MAVFASVIADNIYLRIGRETEPLNKISSIKLLGVLSAERTKKVVVDEATKQLIELELKRRDRLYRREKTKTSIH